MKFNSAEEMWEGLYNSELKKVTGSHSAMHALLKSTSVLAAKAQNPEQLLLTAFNPVLFSHIQRSASGVMSLSAPDSF